LDELEGSAAADAEEGEAGVVMGKHQAVEGVEPAEREDIDWGELPGAEWGELLGVEGEGLGGEAPPDPAEDEWDVEFSSGKAGRDDERECRSEEEIELAELLLQINRTVQQTDAILQANSHCNHDPTQAESFNAPAGASQERGQDARISGQRLSIPEQTEWDSIQQEVLTLPQRPERAERGQPQTRRRVTRTDLVNASRLLTTPRMIELHERLERQEQETAAAVEAKKAENERKRKEKERAEEEKKRKTAEEKEKRKAEKARQEAERQRLAAAKRQAAEEKKQKDKEEKARTAAERAAKAKKKTSVQADANGETQLEGPVADLHFSFFQQPFLALNPKHSEPPAQQNPAQQPLFMPTDSISPVLFPPLPAEEEELPWQGWGGRANFLREMGFDESEL
jgi:hypothetical protein